MKSYVIPCPSGFRDTVLALAGRRGLTATDLALGILTLVDPATIDGLPDPGDPPTGDRESVRLKTGPRKGRSLTRKPRLQVRLPAGLSHAEIRRALALAIDIDAGRQRLAFTSPADEKRQAAEAAAHRTELAKAREALDEMKAAVDSVAFDIAGGAIASAEQASYVLGLPPGTPLNRDLVKSRFRQLSRVYHPDRPTGDTARMSQLIDAARYLESKLPRPFEFKPVKAG